MKKLGFCDTWRTWVQAILSSSKVSILVNGSPTEEFFLEKGVRQGDLVSPFLYIIDAKGLKVALVEANNKGLFEGMEMPKDGPTFSLFQFANDAIFLGK